MWTYTDTHTRVHTHLHLYRVYIFYVWRRLGVYYYSSNSNSVPEYVLVSSLSIFVNPHARNERTGSPILTYLLISPAPSRQPRSHVGALPALRGRQHSCDPPSSPDLSSDLPPFSKLAETLQIVRDVCLVVFLYPTRNLFLGLVFFSGECVITRRDCSQLRVRNPSLLIPCSFLLFFFL